MTSISFYLGMHCSMHNFLGINKLVQEPYQNILTVYYSIYYSVSVLVIRRKDHGLTDIVSNEGRRPEFDTITVRP